jgi:hypothetical protein
MMPSTAGQVSPNQPSSHRSEAPVAPKPHTISSAIIQTMPSWASAIATCPVYRRPAPTQPSSSCSTPATTPDRSDSGSPVSGCTAEAAPDAPVAGTGGADAGRPGYGIGETGRIPETGRVPDTGRVPETGMAAVAA